MTEVPEHRSDPADHLKDQAEPHAYNPMSLSLPSRIAALNVGETCTESKFLDIDKTDRSILEQTTKALRSTVSKAAARATSRTGHGYTTVTGQHSTRSGDLVVVASALRTE